MTERHCNSCTACCEGWIEAKINGKRLLPTAACKHCTNQGCAIYEDRPYDPCVKFKCGWLKEPGLLPEKMSPVECGAIILFDRKWQGSTCICALPTGTTVPADTLEWLMAYSRERLLPLIFTENIFENGQYVSRKLIGYGPPPFVEAVKNAVTAEDIFRL